MAGDLSDDLQKVFGGNAEMAQDILTLAYFYSLTAVPIRISRSGSSS